jgi:hypothetical protein
MGEPTIRHHDNPEALIALPCFVTVAMEITLWAALRPLLGDADASPFEATATWRPDRVSGHSMRAPPRTPSVPSWR